MINKRNIFIALTAVLLIVLGVWLLMDNKGTIAPNGETPAPGKETTVPDKETESSLAEIFAKAELITAYSYEMVATNPDGTVMTIKIWREGAKMRNEGNYGGQDIVYLLDLDEQSAYMYFPDQNTAMEVNWNEVEGIAEESLAEQAASAQEYEPIIIGSEVLDGKDCLVTEYSTQAGTVKMWVWKTYGLPIKTETTTPQGQMTVELKNIQIGDIPDGMFELPAGVQIMQIPSF